MTTVLHLHLDELNPFLIEDLKKQFGRAELEIRVHRPDAHAEVLSEGQFWELMGRLDWSKTGDNEAVIEPLVAALAQMPVANIYQFHDLLAEKLWQLDTAAHAQPFQQQHPKGRLSVDDFLYVRCCVVANGREYFERILRHPAEIPLNLTFSPLLRVADEAFERKTGKPFSHVPAFNYETYSNQQAWA